MPYNDKWSPWDSEVTDDINWSTAKMRLNKTPRKANRVATCITAVDEVFGGGLPEGLTIFYGAAGAGKSLLAKTIAKKFVAQKKRVLQVYGEDSFDTLPPMPPLINNVDMAAWRPGPLKAVKTVLKFVQEMKPDLVVLDSLTTILGATNRAVPEAEIRDNCGLLATKLSGIVPTIGISEIRGNAQYASPAGGWGVAHAGLMTVNFTKAVIDDKWSAQDYHAEFGSVVYMMRVEKDRDGASKQGKTFRVTYMGEEIFLEPVGGG